MMQALRLAFADDAPAMVAAVGMEMQRIALGAGIQAEGAIERLGRGQVGRGDAEMIERMHAQLVRSPRRLHEALDCRHRSLPSSSPIIVLRRRLDC